MSTSTEDRTQLLESGIEEHNRLNNLNKLVEAIIMAGPEGVVYQALTKPEAILMTLATETDLINLLMFEKDMLVERVFELEDELEKYEPSTS
jgi:hypothetical protein